MTEIIVEQPVQTESRHMKYQMKKKQFSCFLAFEEGGIDVGGSMLKKEWCFEGVHAPPTPRNQKIDFSDLIFHLSLLRF